MFCSGLVGILTYHLASSSKSHTFLTDGDSDALKYLRENVKLNTTSTKGKISVKQLIWGQKTATEFLRNNSNDDSTAEEQKFDIILASDIVYSPVIIEPLWETIQILLSPSPSSVFVMAYAKRKVTLIRLRHISFNSLLLTTSMLIYL